MNTKSFIWLSCFVFTVATAWAGAPLTRPVAGQGPKAKTLLIYSGTRTPYSLGDALERVQLHLRRVATEIEAVPVKEATSNKVAAADYLVVFCPEPAPALTTNLLRSIARVRQPVLWIGFGADELDALPSFPGGFEISQTPADRAAGAVNYRGRSWKAPVFPWLPASLTAHSNAKVLMSLEEANSGDAEKQPLCWQTANFTFFAAIPVGETIGFLFSDMLLDFYQAKDVPESQIYFRIQDYSAQSNHREFLRIVDFLYGKGIPFIVSAVPVCKNPATGQVMGLGAAPEFASALRYAQQRGGRIVLHGCSPMSNEIGEGNEFWDTKQDRPLAEDAPDYYRDQLQNVVRQMFKHGLFPLAWETPGYSASRRAYADFAKVFSTGLDRVQLSDSTHLEKGIPSGPTLDRYSRLILPENMGYVLSSETNSFDEINAMGETLTSLRGTVAGCYIHAYQPLPKVAGLVQKLESFHKPFLDLADQNNVVALPEKILLTGNAKRSVTLNNVFVRRMGYDRGGKLLAEEKESEAVRGERTFQKKGLGDYEVIEFVEGTERN